MLRWRVKLFLLKGIIEPRITSKAETECIRKMTPRSSDIFISMDWVMFLGLLIVMNPTGSLLVGFLV